MNLKLRAATALYRWQMASSIISVVFSALAFVGVFAVLFVLPWYYLMAVVMTVVFGTGFLLDRVAKFWSAQATVATVRNQYLVDHLYQKEALNLSEITLPTLRTLLSLSNQLRLSDETRVMLMKAIARVEQTVVDRKWTISADEKVY